MFEAKLDVVSEEEPVGAYRYHIAWHAVELSADPLGGDQGGVDGTEDLFAGSVELLDAFTKNRTMLFHPTADHLIGTTF